jgi:drug/metabolite transporter (DMT)-like permease
MTMRDDRGAKGRAFKHAATFGVLATILLIAAVAGVAFASRFEFFHAGPHAIIAITLGVGGSILLGVGLMALSFFSNRTGADEAVMSRDEFSG